MNITLRQYYTHDGIPSFRNSDILRMYERSVAEGTMSALNFEGTLPGPEAFLRAAQDAFFFAEVMAGDTSCGFVWLNRHEHRRAHAHFCFWRPSPGPAPGTIGREVMWQLLNLKRADGQFAVDCIWGIAPASNAPAIAALKACGVTISAIIDQYIWDAANGRSVAGVHFHITRDAYGGPGA